MIGYTLVGTNDLDRAKTFYDALFGTVGIPQMFDSGRMCVWGTDMSMQQPSFGVTQPHDGAPATAGNGTMIALAFDQRSKVDALHAKAIELGGSCEGLPGIRGEDPDGFYGAYFRDLDGNKLCVFKMGPA